MTTQPLPSPPFIDIPGIANFRDIGGRPVERSHGKVKEGLVFRSADPTKATEDGLKKMSQELGIKVIFDLRSIQEIKRDGAVWEGVEKDDPDPFQAYGMKREWVPVYAEEDYGPEQLAVRYKAYTENSPEGFVKAYEDILKAAGRAYGSILRHLASNTPEPCLVHCTAGKDRTGLLIALLFLLVGVEDEQVAEEYALTDLGLAHLKPIYMERLMKNPLLQGNSEGVKNMVSSKKENMLATTALIRSQFGGAETYLKDYCGLSKDEVASIARNLVVQ